MGKKFLVASLIVTILFLAFLIADYVGWVRYIKLHITPTETYVQGYKNLEKIGDDRIVVCFSAKGEALKNLKPFVNSILDQTVRVDDIALSVPYKDIPKIPADLKKVLSVYGSSIEYPDLVCGVMREPEAKTKIVVVSPDIVYGKDFLQTLLEAETKYPEKVINCDETCLIKPNLYPKNIEEKYNLKYTGNYKKWGAALRKS